MQQLAAQWGAVSAQQQQYQQQQQQPMMAQQQYQHPTMAPPAQTPPQYRVPGPIPQFNGGAVPAVDPRVLEQYMKFLSHATAAQFKPVKLYVLMNDATSVQCVQMVRTSADLDRQVEIVDAAPVENRPKWLRGVPSLMDEQGKYFIGPEAVQWIRYQASQCLAAINETTGTSQIMAGAPSAIDGAASLVGNVGRASSVPQQMIADRDLLSSIDGSRAMQRYEHFLADRNQMPAIPPPTQYGGVGGQFAQPERVGRSGVTQEQLNMLMEQTQNERNALLNRAQMPPHMQQQRMGAWNPIQTEHVGRQGTADTMNAQIALLQQQREMLNVPMRQFQ